MLRTLAKGAAYWKAPVKTFAVLHPRTAIKWASIFLVGKVIYDRAKRRRAAEA